VDNQSPQRGPDGHIERLRTISRTIGYFWQGVTYAGLALATLVAFAQKPALLAQPRGWLIAALVLAYGVWYYAGFRWMVGGAVDGYWRRRINGQGGRISWRGVVYWASLFALTVALIALDDNFKYLVYPLYGMAFAIAVLPDVLALYVPACALMFIAFGWLPRDASLPQLADLGTTLLTLVIFTAMGYLPYYLLKGRFERERVYRELERSHRELAKAHARLEASAGRDRELAVLRERTRLARDMHDTLGHALVLINVKLEASLRLRALDAARADGEITATQRIVRDTMGELRAFLADLRSPPGEGEPCGEKLARLAREMGARAGWTVTYAIDPDPPPLDEPIGEALLRVGAEALVNVERHARAPRRWSTSSATRGRAASPWNCAGRATTSC